MGSSRYVGLAKETTAGTFVSPTRYAALDSETLEPKPITNMFTRSGFSQPTAAHGYGIPITGDITLKAPVVADLLYFVRAFWGLETYAFTANNPVSGVGRHAWTDFSNLPLDGSSGGTQATISLGVNYDINQMQYPGCWSNSWVLTQDIG